MLLDFKLDIWGLCRISLAKVDPVCSWQRRADYACLLELLDHHIYRVLTDPEEISGGVECSQKSSRST